MSFAGTLENIETLAGFSPKMIIPLSTGHATGRPWSFILSEPSVQVDSSTEVPEHEWAVVPCERGVVNSRV